MTHEEIMSAVASGAGSHSIHPFGPCTYPRPDQIEAFRRRLLVTLADLPEEMTVAELRERLDESAEGEDHG